MSRVHTLEPLESRTALVDAQVCSAATGCLIPRLSCPFALLAVGGYGRRELFPHSDVDLLLLFENESTLPDIKEPLADFLRLLWDGGLRASHSVRTIGECCRFQEHNIELHISLLDVRFLLGDAVLFSLLSQRLSAFYSRHRGTILGRLAELARARHAKYHQTVYHLEPNIKESPGGIRDLHLLAWVSQLGPQHDIVRDIPATLDSAKEFLSNLRCFLHTQAGRDNNVLTFERQDQAAACLGYGALPEEWMRIYFRHAREVFQWTLRTLECADDGSGGLLGNFREWRSRLSTAELTVSRERLFIRNPAETLRTSDTILRLFAFVARHGVILSWDAQRRVCARVDESGTFLNPPPRWPLWRELLSQPHAALALRQMQETGVLAAAIPEWHAIDSLVVRDFYHRYTVDEHTLIAIEAIDALAANGPGTSVRLHQLFLEEENPELLRLGLLLHDLGKGTKSGDHVAGSVDTAAHILDRFDVPASDRQAVLFLIERHLDLSTVMNARDLDDPATARFLALRTGSEEDMRRLTLLTYADISAVNPTAMTPWRLEQLWRVYLLGSEQLTRDLAETRIAGGLTRIGSATVPPGLALFLAGFPTRYLRTHTREQIDQHFALFEKSRDEGLAIEIEPSPRDGAYQMTVAAPDRPGLFASLCGALASFGMNILKAEAFSNEQNWILDVIRFDDPMRTLALNPEELHRVHTILEAVIGGSVDARGLLKRRRPAPRPNAAKIAPVVRIDNQASDHSTLIDFVGEDRPGLLFHLAQAISTEECDIEVVLADTQAHKAMDVFYVSRHRQKLDEAGCDRLRRGLIHAAQQA